MPDKHAIIDLMNQHEADSMNFADIAHAFPGNAARLVLDARRRKLVKAVYDPHGKLVMIDRIIPDVF